MVANYEQSFENAEKSLKIKDLAGARRLFNEARKDYQDAGSPALSKDMRDRFKDFQKSYLNDWLLALDKAAESAKKGILDPALVITDLNDFVNEFKFKTIKSLFTSSEEAAIDAKIILMRNELSGGAAIKPTVDNSIIDLNTWTVAQHPQLVKDLQFLVTAIQADLLTPAKNSEVYVSTKLKEVTELLIKVGRQVLDLNTGIFNKKDNKAEIVDFLTTKYMDPAKVLQNELRMQWEVLVSTVDPINRANVLLSVVVNTLSLGQVSSTLLEVNQVLADLQSNSKRVDLIPEQQQVYANKATQLEALQKRLLDIETFKTNEDDKNREHSGWELTIKPLLDNLSKIEALDETKVKPSSKDLAALNGEQISVLIRELDALRTTYTQELSKTKNAKNEMIVNEIIALVGEEGDRGRVGSARQKLERMHDRSKELIPVEQLTYKELIDELWPLDFTELKYGRNMTEGREKQLVIAFNQTRNPLTEPGSDREKLDNLAYKYEYVLKCMDTALYDGTGSASGNRYELFYPPDTCKLRVFGLKREELIMSATYHPEWGEETRRILRWLIEETARESQKIDGVTLNYEALAGDKGRDNLDKVFEKFFPGTTHKDKMAQSFAKKLFTSFDMLSIILQEKEHQTRTRVHNQGLNMPDPVSVQEPLASYIHAEGRYGGNEKDWRAWWLVYLPDLPHDPAHPHDDPYGTGEHKEVIRHVQKLVKMHQRAFMPIEAFAGKIPLPGYCESFFPDTYDLVTLGALDAADPADRNERITILGRTHTKDGQVPTTRVDTELSSFEKYRTAFDSWNELLKLTYQSLPANPTKAQIMEEVKPGGTGGLLRLWLGEAGKTKAFYPKHLRAGLAPMLTHYIYRLVVAYPGNIKEKEELVHEIVEALKHTRKDGGLKAFPVEMAQVIKNLDDKKITEDPRNTRRRQIDEYLDEWYRFETKGKNPPVNIFGRALGINLTHEEKHYLELKREKEEIPDPVQRNGTMIQEKDAK